jgi:hypothetical protein
MRGLAQAKVSDDDWLAVASILESLKGCVKLDGECVGEWNIESGALQGGSLSTPLFQSILPELEQELRNHECGVWVGGMFMTCLGYVDDLVLLASSAKMLQQALRIAQAWAKRVRLRWNIGPNKSAVMLWGRGRTSNKDRSASFRINQQTLPRVSEYKYLGVVFSCGGGWGAHLKALRRKSISRTHEIIAWSRRRACPLTLTERLWRLYVPAAVLFGTGIMAFTKTQAAAVDRCQREAGRRILGFASRSPTPATLLELGWCSWSSECKLEMVRLLSRVATSPNTFIQALIVEASQEGNSWMHKAAANVEHLIDDVCALSKNGWADVGSQLKRSLAEADAMKHMRQAEAHHNLRTYRTLWAVRGEQPGPNLTLHNKKIDPFLARSVNRLIVGGQGLRGGDPTAEPEPTMDSCCLYCLRQGLKRVESLWHVAFCCEAYARCRQQVSHLIDERPSQIFILSRCHWSWTQLKSIIRFLQGIISERARITGTWERTDRHVDDEIARLWSA